MRCGSVFTGNAQNFLERGSAGQHLAATVGANARRGLAGVSIEFLFADATVNHLAHFIIDRDQLVNAGAALESAAREEEADAIAFGRPAGEDSSFTLDDLEARLSEIL